MGNRFRDDDRFKGSHNKTVFLLSKNHLLSLIEQIKTSGKSNLKKDLKSSSTWLFANHLIKRIDFYVLQSKIACKMVHSALTLILEYGAQ
ncbi:MAG: hypothetical protein BGO14_09040 [Chlamydiales bacterium 38-26]|nr:MAG: hypothetical protein BGO14_09040 [Chlamydiales bacterium 38-26]